MQVLKGCLQVTIYASNVYSTGHHFCSLQGAVLEYQSIHLDTIRDRIGSQGLGRQYLNSS